MSQYSGFPGFGHPFHQANMTPQNGFPTQAPDVLNAFENDPFPAHFNPDPAAFAQAFAAFHQNNNMNGFYDNGNISLFAPPTDAQPPHIVQSNAPTWSGQGEPASSFFQQSPYAPSYPSKWSEQQDFYTQAPTQHSRQSQVEGDGNHYRDQHARSDQSESDEYNPSNPQTLEIAAPQDIPNSSNRHKESRQIAIEDGPQIATRHTFVLNQDASTTGTVEVPDTIASANRLDMYGRMAGARARSVSYSPRLSPIATQPIPKGPKSFQPRTRTMARARKVQETPLELDYSEQAMSAVHVPVSTDTLKLLETARKEARDAIVNLMPHNVLFHDYVGEGIDEKIVRAQFEELKLPVPELPKIDDMPQSESVSIAPQSASSKIRPSLPATLSTSTSVKNLAIPKSGTPGEERKDRIARLLAEKAKKNVAPVPSATTSIIAPIMGEKERLLKQKLEALQKSREARAQKLASQPTNVNVNLMTLPASPVRESPIAQISPRPPPVTHLAPRPASIASTSIEHISPPRGAAIQSSLPQPSNPTSSSTTPKQTPSLPPSVVQMAPTPGIPGLFLSNNSFPSLPTTVTSPASKQRKRPVASDFDATTPNDLYHKRPFGQSRQGSKLVIDVSDDDSGDEDSNKPAYLSTIDKIKTGSSTPLHINIGSQLSSKQQPSLIELCQDQTLSSTTPLASLPSTPQSQTDHRGLSQKSIDAQSHAQELLALKKKLALMELRKAKKVHTQTTIKNPTMVNAQPYMFTPAKSSDAVQIVPPSKEMFQGINVSSSHAEGQPATPVTAPAVDSEALKATGENQTTQKLPLLEGDTHTFTTINESDNQAKLASVAEQIANMQRSLDEALRIQAQLRASALTPVHTTSLVTPSSKLTATDTSLPVVGDLKTVPAAATTDDASEVLATPSNNTVLGNVEHEVDSLHRPVSDNNLDPSSSIICGNGSLDAALQASIANEVGITQGLSSDIDMAETYAPDPNALAPVFDEDSAESLIGEVMSLDDISDNEELAEPTTTTEAVSGSMPTALSSASPAAVLNTGVNGMHIPSGPPTPTNYIPVQDGLATIIPPSIPAEPVMGNSLPTGTDGEVSHVATVTEDQQLTHTASRFIPYQSPLRMFHQYRFHPDFTNQVDGGFKSLTYSNKIKASEELCPNDLMDGICNDMRCDFQHFKEMEVPDDFILVQLGNVDGFTDVNQKHQFIAGLRTTLTDLRAQKVKDFGIIAGQIAAFRSKFLEDPSSVLNLGNVSV